MAIGYFDACTQSIARATHHHRGRLPGSATHSGIVTIMIKLRCWYIYLYHIDFFSAQYVIFDYEDLNFI